jgi:hypothetical protein
MQGLVQWVPEAFDLQRILDEYGDIRLFFQVSLCRMLTYADVC